MSRHVDGRPRRQDLVRRQDGAWRDAKTHVLTHTLHYGWACSRACAATRPSTARRSSACASTPSGCSSAQIFRMKIPFTARAADRGAARVRARQQARVVLHPPARVLRLARRWASRPRRTGARGDRRLALGRLPRRRGLEEGIRVKTSSLHAPPSTSRCAGQGRVATTPTRSSPTWKRRTTATTRRCCSTRRASSAEGAGENMFIVKDGKLYTPDLSGGALERHHARHDHHVRERPRHAGRREAHHARRGLHRRRGVLHRHRRRGDADPRARHRPIGAGTRGPITEKIQTRSSTSSTAAIPRRSAWLTKV